MSEPLFDVWFSGALRPGFDGAAVRQALGELFKVDAARVDALFAAPSRVRRGVDAVTAQRYEAALARVGAIVEVRAVEVPDTSAAAAGPGIALALAEVGVDLVTPAPVPAPQFNLDHYTLAEPGVLLVEARPVPVREFDLEGLALLPLDAPDYAPVPPPPVREFDTGRLSLLPLPAPARESGAAGLPG